jgi:putative DNA primase/helicase
MPELKLRLYYLKIIMPTQLKHHLDEWTVQSGIDPEIVKLNLESVRGKEKIEEILGFYSGYELGWIARGINLQTMEQHEKFTQFKPDNPVIFKDEKKPRKYLTPKKEITNYDAIALALPDPDHWRSVLDDWTQPVVITEGVKKAGALLTCGFNALALIGVDCGLLNGKQLVDSIRALCTGEREFIFCFDYDDNPETVKNVESALKRLAAPLLRKGHRIAVAQWDNKLGKGIDDVLVTHGVDEVREIVVEAIPYKKWSMPDQKFSDDAKPKKVLESPKPKDVREKKKAPNEYFDFSKVDLNCGDRTFDSICLHRVFGNGEGEWKSFNGSYYRYEKGYFRIVPDESIKQLIGKASEEAYILAGKDDNIRQKHPFSTMARVDSACRFVQAMIAEPQSALSKTHIAFRNGSLNLETKKLEDHCREHYLTSCIDADYVEWDDSNECPKVFKDFVAGSFGEELLPLIRALVATYVNPSAPYGHFIHFIGASGSGKTTMLEFFASLVGKDHRTGINDLSVLTTPEKRHQNLSGKSIIFLGDIAGRLENVNEFYELVTNGEMSGRALYLSSIYNKRWDLRFLLASVDMLSVENSGDGWDRRCIPLPTKAIDPKRKTDNKLGEKLQACKAEVISWALALANDERDYLLRNPTSTEVIARLKHDQSLASDTVKVFVDYCLEPIEGEDNKLVPKDDLYDLYKAFCLEFGYKSRSERSFSNHVYGCIPNNELPSKVIFENGKSRRTQRCLAHIQIKPSLWTRKSQHEQPTFNKVGCTEGGMIAIADFWASKQLVSTKKEAITSTEVVISPNSENVVSSENGSSNGSLHNYIYQHIDSAHIEEISSPNDIKNIKAPENGNLCVDTCNNLTPSNLQLQKQGIFEVVDTCNVVAPSSLNGNEQIQPSDDQEEF